MSVKLSSSGENRKKIVDAAVKLCSSLVNLSEIVVNPKYSGKLFNQIRPSFQKVMPGTAASCCNTASTDR